MNPLPTSAAKMKIAFLLPTNSISGGVFVVFLQAKALRAAGHDVTIIFARFDSTLGFKSFREFDLKFLIHGELPHGTVFDIGIATWWETFYELPEIPAKKHFYFVQSDERKFYSPEDEITRNWVELTYSFPEIGIITEAKWIQKFLQNDFNLDVTYGPNGVDSKLFSPTVTPLAEKGDRLRVLIEGPGGVDFKRVEDAFAITQAFNDIEVWYVCSDGNVKSQWRFDRLFKAVPFDDMPSIYRSCDILIKVSAVEGFFGPPLEMMATGGTCIVSNVTGCDEYVRDGENALVIPIGSIADGRNALSRLKNDRELRDRLSKEGVATAARFDWKFQFPKFEQALMKLFEEKEPVSRETLKAIRILGKLRLATRAEINSKTLELQRTRYRLIDSVIERIKSIFPKPFHLAMSAVAWLNDVYFRKRKSAPPVAAVAHSPSPVLEEKNTPSDFSLNPGPTLFVGQPEYFRSVYQDALSKNGAYEFPVASGNLAPLALLGDFVTSKGCKNVIVFRPEWLHAFPSTLTKIKNSGCKIIGYSTEPVPLDFDSRNPSRSD